MALYPGSATYPSSTTYPGAPAYRFRVLRLLVDLGVDTATLDTALSERPTTDVALIGSLTTDLALAGSVRPSLALAGATVMELDLGTSTRDLESGVMTTAYLLIRRPWEIP